MNAPAAPVPDARVKPRFTLWDVTLCLGLLALGVALRWPQLWNIPVFTDEWDEIAVSLAIVREGARPLTNADAYYGALTSYLMAGFFLLSGISIEAPRLFALTLGALQLLPTYLLGVEIGRAAGLSEGRARVVGGSAGLLLAASAAHIVLNSHLAWANSTTPLFTTVALWLLLLARRQWEERGAGRLALLGAGLSLGLALQTHILVIALIVGATCGALLTMPRLAFSRWGMLAGLALFVGYGNMLVFNVMTSGQTIRHARAMSEGYAGGKEISYLEKLNELLLSLLRVTGGALDRRESDQAFLTDPVLVLGLLAALVGIGRLARHRQWTPLCVLIAMVGILPLVNNRYEPLFSGRYLSPLLPLLFGSLSLVLVLRCTQILAGWRGPALAAGLAVLLSGYSLWQLQGLYGRLERSGRTNERVLSALSEVRSNLQAGDVVYLDNRLSRRKLMEAGAGDMERVFRSLLDVSQVPYQVVSIDDAWIPSQPGLLILASRDNPRSTAAVIERLRLSHPSGGPATAMEDGAIFELYRAPRRA